MLEFVLREKAVGEMYFEDVLDKFFKENDNFMIEYHDEEVLAVNEWDAEYRTVVEFINKRNRDVTYIAFEYSLGLIELEEGAGMLDVYEVEPHTKTITLFRRVNRAHT